MRFGDLRNRVFAINQGSSKSEGRVRLLSARPIVIKHLFVAELRFLQLVAGDNETAFLLNFTVSVSINCAGFNAIAHRIGFALPGRPLPLKPATSTIRGSCKATTFSVFCKCAKAASASATQAKDRLVNALKALYSAWLCFRCCLLTVCSARPCADSGVNH